jgi:predicted Zn-dependent protease
MFVMVRFGMWEQMLAEPKPDTESEFMTGIWHYGRAIAYIHTNRLAEARREPHPLKAAEKAMSDVKHYIGFSTAKTLLTIAHEVVQGELAYADGNTLVGLAHLERAVRLEDSLRYNEPPDWYFPVRHFLGAMLLDVGRPGEAEVVYAADLRKNPENGYSLFGLKLALERQGKHEDASAVGKRFDRAWVDANHKLASSRF